MFTLEYGKNYAGYRTLKLASMSAATAEDDSWPSSSSITALAATHNAHFTERLQHLYIQKRDNGCKFITEYDIQKSP